MDQYDPSHKLEMAVFTIPGMVAFEGQHHLLHIFEPRYQKMVKYCVENRSLLGLALPKYPSATGNGAELDIKPNQKKIPYFQANKILSAGLVNIVKELEDGRFLIAVSIKCRFRIIDMVQSLPFFIANAVALPSRVENIGLAEHTFQRLKNVSEDILGEKFVHFEKRVPHFIWERKDLHALLVRVMEWFRLEGHELQKLLEEDVVETRAARFIDVMELYYKQLQSRLEQESSHPDISHPSKIATPLTSSSKNVIKVNFGKAK